MRGGRVVAAAALLALSACSLLFEGDGFNEGSADASASGGGGQSGSSGSGGKAGSAGGGGAAAGAGAGGAAAGAGAGGASAGGGGTGGGGTGGGGTGGGGTGGSGTLKPCAVAYDDFNDGVLASGLYPFSAGVVKEEAGVLLLQLDPTQQQSVGISTHSVDMRDCSVSVEIVKPLQLSGASTGFLIEPEPYALDASLIIELFETSSLRWGLEGKQHAEPFDPIAHGWWRMSSSGGTSSFAVSQDGKQWKTLGSVPTPAALKYARVSVYLSPWEKAQAGEAAIDNFNL
ncbi:MAG: hypothetical protein R3B13_11800 [Polyangiaceae bacterium]